MSLRYLLDTNILSETAKPSPSRRVWMALQGADGAIATAATVWQELVFGTARLPEGRRKRRLEAWLAHTHATVPVLPYDDAAARWFGLQRAKLTSRGRVMPIADGQIAAVAAVNALVLVTRNVKDFEGYEGLIVEDWFES